VESAGFSSQPTDMIPWKMKMACQLDCEEMRREMSVEEVRSAATNDRLEVSDTPLG
jgi:hypothetical protein